MDRPELHSCIYEIIAPAEYNNRVPQRPIYVFLIDVSSLSLNLGVPKLVSDALKTHLSQLAENPRAQVAIVTFDSSLHFYRLNPDASSFRISVSSVLTEVCAPPLDEIFLDLAPNLGAILSLVERLPSLHASSVDTGSTLGTAIQTVEGLIPSLGGKLLVFTAAAPSLGEGALPPRVNPQNSIFSQSIDATASLKPAKRRVKTAELTKVMKAYSGEEHSLLRDNTEFYSPKAIRMNEEQFRFDLFSFAREGTASDIAALSYLPQFSGGKLQTYSVAEREGEQVDSHVSNRVIGDVGRALLQPSAWEAVCRVRISGGLEPKSFTGSFVVRNQDLVCFPTVQEGETISMCVQFEDKEESSGRVNSDFVYFQSAILYTTCRGERRIRVYNLALPVVLTIAKFYASVNLDAYLSHQAKISIKKTRLLGFSSARSQIQSRLLILLRKLFRLSGTQNTREGVGALSKPIRNLALSTLGLLKCEAFCDSLRTPAEALRHGAQLERERLFIFPQSRLKFQSFVNSAQSSEIAFYVRPLVFGLLDVLCCEDFSAEALPEILSGARMDLNSLVMVNCPVLVLFDAQRLLVRVSRDCEDSVREAIFVEGGDDVQEFHFLEEDPEYPSGLLERLQTLLSHLRGIAKYSFVEPRVRLSSDAFDRECGSFLLEERTESVMSLEEFLKYLLKTTGSSYN